ncbi:hypothetical protein LBMAG53_29390 [Planctomycetota bacterium]|nr:hypothetical protein LBMAG53_29390 [Planctomycetota bacterium]
MTWQAYAMRLPLLATAAAIACSAALGAGEAAPDFATKIKPIFDERCISCHGEKKVKAGLRLDTPAGITAGGKSGAAVVAGKPEASKLVTLISHPAGHEDIMPPKGGPLTKEQIELIKAWVAGGAVTAGGDAKAKPAESKPQPFMIPVREPRAALPADQTAAPSTLLERCAKVGLAVSALPGSTGLYEVNARHLPTPWSAAESDLVGRLGSGVVSLDLSPNTTDAHLAVLTKLPALVHLRLAGTAITDSGLETVAKSTRLERLDLRGTVVTDAGLDQIAKLPALQSVVLIGTKTTADGVAKLRAALPKLVVKTDADLPAGDPATLSPEGKRPRK